MPRRRLSNSRFRNPLCVWRAILFTCALGSLDAVEVVNRVYSACALVEVHEQDPIKVIRAFVPENETSVVVRKQRYTGLFEIWITAFGRAEVSKRLKDFAGGIRRKFVSDGRGNAFIIREWGAPRSGSPPKAK